MKEFCPNCLSNNFNKENKERIIKVRETNIEYLDVFNICLDCRSEFESNDEPDILKNKVYPAYRKIYGMTTPEEFNLAKNKINLSNKDLAKMMKIRVSTVDSFERGNLQTIEFDKLLKKYITDKSL